MTAHSASEGWAPRGSLDLAQRKRKFQKMAALLERHRTLAGARVLEIGTGAGVIAESFVDAVGPEGSVVSIDVNDLRLEPGNYQFRIVEGVVLPFDADSFDIVITNQVIEHVGGAGEQQMHLAEIKRVLGPDGICYLATPNRWGIVEPHFGLPFLSWLPDGPRDRYLRVAKGRRFDIRLLSLRELRAMAGQNGFALCDESAAAVAAMQSESRAAAWATKLPPGLVARMAGVLPTLVVTLTPV